LSGELLGQILDGRYEILEKIEEGGMGAIYKARQLRLDRIVALKLLLHDRRGDPISVERFRHEAYLASRLRHPHAIHVYDFGQAEDGLLYIAMEFLEGETLKERMENGAALPIATAVQIISQTLRTITEAHRLGLIHRDLKPDNIFLARIESNVDYVKVLDFGIAKLTAVQDGLVEGYQGGLTVQGKIYGTPNYMSPEQIRSKTVDHQSDLYSLGVLFFEMLVGRRPFEAETPVDVMMMHLRDDPPDIRSFDPDLPEALDNVVKRALAKDRRERFQSGQEFLDTLQSFRADSGFYRLPPESEPGDEPDGSLDATVIPEESVSGSVLHLSLDSSVIESVGSMEASSAMDDLGLDDEKTVLEMGELDDEGVLSGVLESAGLKTRKPQYSEPPQTQAMPANAFAATESFEESPSAGERAAEESISASFSSVGGASAIDDPDTLTSARHEEEIAAEGSVSFLSVDMESIAEDEATFLELAEEEFDEVEASRLVPIPDLGATPTRLPAPTPGRLPAVRNAPLPGPPLGGASAPSAPVDGVQVSAQIRQPVVVRPGSKPDMLAAQAQAAPAQVERPAPAAAQPQVARPNVSRPQMAAVSSQPQPVYDATGPVKGRSSDRKALILKIAGGLLLPLVGVALVVFLLPDLFESAPPAGPLQLEIASTPSPIEVFDDGRYAGETPLVYPLDKASNGHKLQFGVGNKTYRAKVGACDQQTWIYVSMDKPSESRELGTHLITSGETKSTVEIDGKVRGQTPFWLIGPEANTVALDVIGPGGQRTKHKIKPTLSGGRTEISAP